MQAKQIGSMLISVLLVTSLIFPSFILTITISQTASANTSPGDWPMFHHDPQRSGYATDFGPSENNLLWWHATGGEVMSSPAVVAGRVFVCSSDDCKVYCISADDGSVIWSYFTANYVGSSPAVVANRVFIVSDYALYCLDADNGDMIWTYLISSYVSPAVVGGRVYVGSRNKQVYCISADDGHDIWSYATGDYVSSTAVAGGRVYAGSEDGKLYCLDANDGDMIWSYATGGGVFSSPAVAGGRVYVGSKDNKVYCFSADKGDMIWSYATGGGVFSSPAVAGGRVYVGSDDCKVYCLSADDGDVIWSYATSGRVISSPAVAGGRVYAGSGDGKLYCLDANNGDMIWSYLIGSFVYSSPAVSGDRVYVGSGNVVYCFGPGSIAQRMNPTVTLTPDYISGPAGATLTYSVNIKNNDDPAFGTSIFSLDYTVPSGWLGSLNNPSVLLNPGQTDPSVILTVTPSPTATAGDYTITITATNSGATTYQGRGSATYALNQLPTIYDYWLPWKLQAYWGVYHGDFICMTAIDDSEFFVDNEHYNLPRGNALTISNPQEGTHVGVIRGRVLARYYWRNNSTGLMYDDTHLFYNLLPSTALGKEYCIPCPGEVGVVATKNNTSITYFDGSVQKKGLINRGEVLKFQVGRAGWVQADKVVSVAVGSVEKYGTNYGYSPLPNDLLGTEYYLDTNQSFKTSYGSGDVVSEFYIMAPTGANIMAGDEEFNLGPMDRMIYSPESVSGVRVSYISSDKPISVILVTWGTYTAAIFPEDAGEQACSLLPTTLWANDYVLSIPENLYDMLGLGGNNLKENGRVFHVISKDQVEVQIFENFDGIVGETKTLDAGVTELTFENRSVIRIKSDKPIEILEMTNYWIEVYDLNIMPSLTGPIAWEFCGTDAEFAFPTNLFKEVPIPPEPLRGAILKPYNKTFYEEWSSFVVGICYAPPASATAKVVIEDGFQVKDNPQTVNPQNAIIGTAEFPVSIGDVLGISWSKDVTYRVIVTAQDGNQFETQDTIKVLNHVKLEGVQRTGWVLSSLDLAALETCAYSATANPDVKSDVEAFIKDMWGDITDNYQLAKAICNWTFESVEKVESSWYAPFWQLWQGIRSGGKPQGDCKNFAILYVGMCRAAGLQVRFVTCMLEPEDSLKGFTVAHNFAEVFINGQWIHADPTWDKFDAPSVYERGLYEGDEGKGVLFAIASGLVDRTNYYHSFAPDP